MLSCGMRAKAGSTAGQSQDRQRRGRQDGGHLGSQGPRSEEVELNSDGGWHRFCMTKVHCPKQEQQGEVSDRWSPLAPALPPLLVLGPVWPALNWVDPLLEGLVTWLLSSSCVRVSYKIPNIEAIHTYTDLNNTINKMSTKTTTGSTFRLKRSEDWDAFERAIKIIAQKHWDLYINPETRQPLPEEPVAMDINSPRPYARKPGPIPGTCPNTRRRSTSRSSGLRTSSRRQPKNTSAIPARVASTETDIIRSRLPYKHWPDTLRSTSTRSKSTPTTRGLSYVRPSLSQGYCQGPQGLY
ncbi:hypothetical protein QBC40DRAFT_346512 [Triangularia verruculosa]|uniref:Uncharacterized protein n=1 Tax=Triangularia verruculosa TaxID=2587418 RepID=A0AAN7AY42_9PEZI|nr:hypothetical protein QBC40DRAFT_346512 [Triangularia verruculosa]